jgi:hypothetical protein
MKIGQKITIALINDTDGKENIGCRLTSSGMKFALLRSAFQLSTGIEILSCPWRFRRRAKLGVILNCALRFSRGGLASKWALRTVCAKEYGRSALKKIKKARIVVYQPEGSISDDHGELRILRQACLALYAAAYLNKPLIIMNGTFPLFNDIRRDLILSLVRLSVSTYLRDRLSAEHYQVGFSPDAAILWESQYLNSSEGRDCVLITTAAHSSSEENLQLANSALRFCRKNGLRPMVLTKDWQHLNPLREQIERIGGVFVEKASLTDADALLSNCRLHIGGRYHMAIFCATQGIPSLLVVSNTHKNVWLAEDFHGIEIIDPQDYERGISARLSGVVPRQDLLSDVETFRKLCRSRAYDALRMLMSEVDKPKERKHVNATDLDVWRSPYVRSRMKFDALRR